MDIAKAALHARLLADHIMNCHQLTLSLVLMLGLVGCNSDNNLDNSGDSNNPTNGDAVSDVDLVGFAYQAAGLASQSGGDPGFQNREPQAETAPRATTTTPCAVGNFEVTKQSNETTYEYKNCENAVGTLNQVMDGRSVTTDIAPVVGYTQTQQTALENLNMRFSVGDDFVEQRINGNHVISSNPESNTLTESDIRNDMSYQCGNARGSLTNEYTMTAETETTSDGLRYNTELAMSVSDHGAFNGDYTVSTLESVYYQSGSVTPYMGVQTFMLPDGRSLTVRYETSGLYIEQDFYTWGNLMDEAHVRFPDTSNCFGAGSDTGAANGGENGSGDGSNTSQSLSATIDGKTYTDWTTVSANYFADRGYGITSYLVEYNPVGARGFQFLNFEGPAGATKLIYRVSTEGSHFYSWENDDVNVAFDDLGPDLMKGTFSGTLYPNDDNPANQQHTLEVTNGVFFIIPYDPSAG